MRDLSSETTKRRDGTGVGQLGGVINTDIGSVGCRAPQRRQTDELTGREGLLRSLCARTTSCGCVTAYWTVNTSFKLSLVLLDGFAKRLNNNCVNNKQFQTISISLLCGFRLAKARFCN